MPSKHRVVDHTSIADIDSPKESIPSLDSLQRVSDVSICLCSKTIGTSENRPAGDLPVFAKHRGTSSDVHAESFDLSWSVHTHEKTQPADDMPVVRNPTAQSLWFPPAWHMVTISTSNTARRLCGN